MSLTRKRYQMDRKQADATLQKVFAACEQPPNQTSFDKLLLRRQADTRLLNSLLLLTALILLLTLLFPLVIDIVNVTFPPAQAFEATLDTTEHFYIPAEGNRNLCVNLSFFQS